MAPTGRRSPGVGRCITLPGSRFASSPASLYPGPVPTEPDPSLDLGSQARRHPDATAIVMGGTGESLSYRELDDGSNRFARLLRARGVTTGEHVALLMENNAAYLEVAWAAQRSGLYYTALNSHLRSAEVQYILDDCGATALVTSPAMADVVARRSTWPGSRCGSRWAGPSRASSDYEAAVAALRRRRPSPTSPRAGRCCTRRGRPGRPKGVRKPLPLTPLGRPVGRAGPDRHGLGRGRRRDPASVYLSPAPLYHSAPLVYSHVDAPPRARRSWSWSTSTPPQCLELIERHG